MRFEQGAVLLLTDADCLALVSAMRAEMSGARPAAADREVLSAVLSRAAAYRTGRLISACGSDSAEAAETGEGLGTAEVASRLHVTPRRARQLLAAFLGSAARDGRDWRVSSEVVAELERRRGT